MKPPEVYYYVTGGTLRPDAPSYVERKADTELLESLLKGDFCYVLTSRQMGKSSLMVRTVRRLREQGTAVAVLDLTAIGQNLTVEQWYEGLAERLGQQLNLDVEIEDFWLDHPRLSPVQRFFGAIREVAMKHREGRLILFVDEIDSVRSLPFSTDEFFAAIRESYNRRAVDSEYNQLAFCLLGVATPADLIRDTRTTPFNIGQRIELTDFTGEEAAGLAPGLQEGRTPEQVRELICRILYWTHGHPYLTQRLCKAVAEHTEVQDRRGVDMLCEDLFLSDRARERDDNLVFVRDRILRSEQDRVSLLDLYLRIWQGRPVKDDPGSSHAGILRLAGIVRCQNGLLTVRMRIYERVFNKKWVQSHMPDAELRRQKEAFNSGILRTAAVAVLLILLIGGLARYGFEQAEQARISERAQIFEHQRSEEARMQMAAMLEQMEVRQAEDMFRSQRSATALAYLAHALRNNYSNRVAVARLITALSQRNFALPILDSIRVDLAPNISPPANRTLTVKGETVNVLNEDGEPVTEQPLRHEGNVRDAHFSPEGQRVVTASVDNTARVWDATSGLPITPPLKHGGPVWTARFSPEGQRVATLSLLDRSARIWDATTGQPITEPIRVPGVVRDIEFSADGQILIVRAQQKNRFGWDIRPGGMLSLSMHQEHAVNSVSFSPDGKSVLVAARDSVRVWDAMSGELICPPIEHERSVSRAVFNHSGTMIATACDDSKARVWNAVTGEPVLKMPLAHQREVRDVNFSPDDKRLATASFDGTAAVWNLETGDLALPPLQHEAGVFSIKFSRDGKWLVTTSRDSSARMWDASTGTSVGKPMIHEGPIFEAEFNADGTRLVTASADNTARIWSVQTCEPLTEPMPHNGIVHSVHFSPDGKYVLTASADRTARLWDAGTGQPVGSPFMHESSVVHGEFFPSGQRIVTATVDRSISVWDTLNGQSLTEIFPASPGGKIGNPQFFETLKNTDLDSSGTWIASAGHDGNVQVLLPLNPPLPAPEWLASLAEAISGERITQRGLLETVEARELSKLRDFARSAKGKDFYSEWVRWFFADRTTRNLSVLSPLKADLYIQRKLADGGISGIQEVLKFSPTNATALARLALARMGESTPASTRVQTEALFLTLRAVSLAPKLPEVWRCRSEVLALSGDTQGGLKAIEHGLTLDIESAGLWNTKGFVLERMGQLAAADAAYTKAIELAEGSGQKARHASFYQNRTFLRQRMSTEPPGGATRD